MNDTKRFPRGLLLAVSVALVMMIIAAVVVNRAERSRGTLPIYGNVPEFNYTECRGGAFGLKNMLGNISVVDFIFTRCQGPCPIMATKFQQLYNRYMGTNDIQLVSISVDPDYDTPDVLYEYAQAHGVYDNRWVFLHASADEVVDLSEHGFKLAAGQLPMGHSAKFVLVDRKGRIRGYYSSQDDAGISALEADIASLYKEKS
jgi:protein SCO1/2